METKAVKPRRKQSTHTRANQPRKKRPAKEDASPKPSMASPLLSDSPSIPKSSVDAAGLARSNSQIRIRVNPATPETYWIDDGFSSHGKTAGKGSQDSLYKSYVIKFFNRFLHGTTPIMSAHDADGTGDQGLHDSLANSLMKTLTASQVFYLKFIFYTLGLVGTFLAWGILQEKIMTSKYPPDGATFPYSLICILGNRMAAMVISGLILTFTEQPTHTAPLYVYLYPSLSNLLSTTCQYEALKYISFIAQVLMKCAKVIPVMLMGTVVSRKRYSGYEYMCAVFISFGTALFMIISSQDNSDNNPDRPTEFSWYGLLLMAMYLFFDSFTSTIQARLYDQYAMTSNQMMFYVNVVSTPLLFLGLLWDNQGVNAASFIHEHPLILGDIFMLSLSGGIGQNFIYITIKDFGAVTYSVIMTVRQFLSIFSSNYLFQHNLGTLQWMSLSLVFVGTFLHVNAKKAKSSVKPKSATRV